ncbi:hypothetical protein ArV1_049 [Arthrobacter phage vB_ArtM-ArV1]|uniref:Uncharacterized protein n=1 Tax=Arthrobacter phage vB_ArtM-ArV1 TaxID=1566993 RepID=A0A0A7HAN5_9CAUD|nr:hypothetical protein ArV1_049 [Arthrobacter phage vB_ArtM-ArV1]AIZ01737.1 hypothetical protein ArV1_049 [Arthrobacter phage vB_ArtM-ArV1]
MTTLDEIRERTRSALNTRLRTLKIEPDPIMGEYSPLLAATDDGLFNLILTVSDGNYDTPVVPLADAHQIVHAARDAHALMLALDAIRAQVSFTAEQFRNTSNRLNQEVIDGSPDRDVDAAARYANYASANEAIASRLDKIIDDVLNPKEEGNPDAN